MTRRWVGLRLACGLTVLLSLQLRAGALPGNDAIRRVLSEDGEDVSNAKIENITWHVGQNAGSGVARIALIGGNYKIYVIGPNSEDAFEVHISDLGTGAALGSWTLNGKLPPVKGILKLNRPSICEFKVRPAHTAMTTVSSWDVSLVLVRQMPRK